MVAATTVAKARGGSGEGSLTYDLLMRINGEFGDFHAARLVAMGGFVGTLAVLLANRMRDSHGIAQTVGWVKRLGTGPYRSPAGFATSVIGKQLGLFATGALPYPIALITKGGEAVTDGAAAWPALDPDDLRARLACLGELYDLVFGWPDCAGILGVLASGLAARHGLTGHAAELSIEAHLEWMFNAAGPLAATDLARRRRWTSVADAHIELGTQEKERCSVAATLTDGMLRGALPAGASSADTDLYQLLLPFWGQPTVRAVTAQLGHACPVAFAGLKCPWGATCARAGSHEPAPSRLGRQLRAVLTECNLGVELA